jgi:SAM-dependent methyltransferase
MMDDDDCVGASESDRRPTEAACGVSVCLSFLSPHSNRIESNRIESNRIESNRIESNRSIVMAAPSETVEVSSEAFWEHYYAGLISGDSELVEQPSPFAEWVLPRVKACDTENGVAPTLLEVGCGNGRDAIYFARCGVAVTATDRCPEAIKLTGSRLPEGSRAEVASASELPVGKVNFAFARFVLHALDVAQQAKVLNWVAENVTHAFFVETRSTNDPRCGKGVAVGDNAFVDTHYRRFMSIDDLKHAAYAANLDVSFVEEASSGSGKDGAMVIRAALTPRSVAN